MIRCLSTVLGLLGASAAVLLYPNACAAKTYNVSPGMSIQKTLDKIQPGDTVQVLAGTYHESILIDTENVTLIGLSYEGDRPVLNGTHDAETLELAIAIAADGVTVEGFVIQDYGKAGVVADAVNDIALADLIIRNSGAAGVMVDDAGGLTLQRVVVSEMTGVAAYILESMNVSINDSEFLLSPYGLVLVDCVQCTVQNSGFYGNAVGIIVASGPDPPRQGGDHVTLRYCRILENNGEKAYPEDQKIAGLPTEVPGGIGVAILGADHTVLSDSIVVGNASCGVATYAHPDATAPTDNEGEESTAGIPDHSYVHHNTYADNGTAPTEAFKKQFAGAEGCDLYWDGSGVRNQWQENTDLKTHPENLVVEQGGVHTDVIHFL